LRILHVWDNAGVSYILAKHQRDAGHTADVIKRAGADPFGIAGCYGYRPRRFHTGGGFIRHVVKLAYDYDTIHVHSIPSLVTVLRRKHPKRNIVMHWHGSELMKAGCLMSGMYGRLADLTLVSTKDLLRYAPGAVWLPNPVDTDMFSPRDVGDGDSCVYLGKRNQWRIAKSVFDENYDMPDLRLSCFFSDVDPVMYADMPGFLSGYGRYLDIKLDGSGGIATEESLTALQALALGMRVLGPDGFVMDSLPDMHRAGNVATSLDNMYREAFE